MGEKKSSEFQNMAINYFGNLSVEKPLELDNKVDFS
jgi:hypothetical protein